MERDRAGFSRAAALDSGKPSGGNGTTIAKHGDLKGGSYMRNQIGFGSR